ncbi:MAG: T9SS type A sorting domain-containing protein [Prolixibacteraceae bacterium]|nr:T9SS type A sorting domain-containing protein [Prolixibacteraceae bacterium]
MNLKHLFTLAIIALLGAQIMFAQNSNTINLETAGTLSSALTSVEKNSINDLTITGNIDARDFKTMRDGMEILYYHEDNELDDIVLSVQNIGQTTMTYVPDDNFEQALINLDYDDVLDDSVLTANINTITNLDVSETNISHLTGIEDFVGLKSLKCSNNQLKEVDVSKNTKLVVLWFANNQLTSIDISKNTNIKEFVCTGNQLESLEINNNIELRKLYCYENKLTDLDISNNTALTFVSCGFNKMVTLDISNNINLQKLYCNNNRLTTLNLKNGNNSNLTDMEANGNAALFCIEVDDAANANANANWQKDGIATYNEDCSNFDVPHFEMTYIPDDNFENALIELGYDSGEPDDSIPLTTIQTVTELQIDNMGISDLTGIEKFTALKALYCSHNNLKSIDVSKNTALNYLHCHDNELVDLNVSNNPNLFCFHCYNNKLKSIDVSNIKWLQYFYCGNNALTEIDVSNNSRLQYFGCGENQLNELDLSNNINLIDLMCYGNQLDILDLSQNIMLEELSANLSGITSLKCNEALKYIDCGWNYLETIDISQNVELAHLNLYGNKLISLDVSQNEKLKFLDCRDNQLTSLNLKNGFNHNMTNGGWETGMQASSNPNLTCIQVDDPTAAANFSDWDKDATAIYSKDCSMVGLSEFRLEEVNLYPNPVNDIVNIESSYEIKQIRVVSISGAEVMMKKASLSCLQLNMATLVPGTYLIEITTTNGFVLKTINKE